MISQERARVCLYAALEVFLLFFGFVFSQAIVTIFLIVPYTFAATTRFLAQGMGANQAALEVSRAITEDFLPRHTTTVGIVSSLLAVGVLLLVYRKLHPPIKDSLGFHKSSGRSFLPIFPLAVGLQIFISVLVFWVMNLPAMSEFAQQMEEYTALISGGDNRILELFAVVIAGPVCEELFFRGAIQSALKRTGMPLWVAVTVQAALFGIVHGLPLQMAYAFLIGLVFGFLTQKQGCLWHSILLHALFNAAGYWSELLTDNTAPLLFVFLFVCAAVVCFTTLFMIFYTPKNKGEPHAA